MCSTLFENFNVTLEEDENAFIMYRKNSEEWKKNWIFWTFLIPSITWLCDIVQWLSFFFL